MGLDARLLATSPRTSVPGADLHLDGIWRPVQYLGSKLRSVEVIMEQAASLPSSGVFWDAFSGSTVVAQAAALNGFSVHATDTQAFSQMFAHALLRIDAGPDEEDALASHVEEMFEARHPQEGFWQPWVTQEDEALARGDYASLTDLYDRLPQRWKPGWRMADTAHTPLTTTYAGTYLSLRQAMALDAARIGIRDGITKGNVSAWQAASLITLLCHAASRAVHSAGKHFAQPIQRTDTDSANFSFVSRRALADRSVSVHEQTVRGIQPLRKPRGAIRTHRADNADALTVQPSELPEGGIVYADPPYTAQQYSRFYHLLEVLTAGHEMPLQVIDGKTPRGIYPADRYMSPFCSKRQATAAFMHLIRTAHESRSHLLMSYSPSSQISGNQRTISLNALESLISDTYGPAGTRVLSFEHSFRQFNSIDRRQDARQTGEVLIVAEAK